MDLFDFASQNTQPRIAELEAAIRRANDLYWNQNAPEIPDPEYDALVEELKRLDPANPLVTQLAPVELKGPKVTHSRPMLSLDKAYSLPEILKWVNKYARTPQEKIYIQPKFDGISGLLEHGVLSSRGDGITGEDYTAKLPIIKFVTDKQIDLRTSELLGEIVIGNEAFATTYRKVLGKSGQPLKNQRNGVAGIIGTDDVDFYRRQGAYLEFVDYDFIRFEVPANAIERDWEKIKERIATTVPYPMDGIVLKLADADYANSLGATDHHPRGAIAYKFTNRHQKTTLKGIEWTMGKRQLSAVGLLEPVELGGVTISRVRLPLTMPVVGEMTKCLLDGSLSVGDEVTVERAGDVIPHLIDAQHTAASHPVRLEACPFCGGRLAVGETAVECTNPECGEKQVQKLYAFIVSLGFLGIAEAFVRKLYENNNTRTLGQLVNLQPGDLDKKLYGDKTTDLFFSELAKAKTAPLTAFLAALNIPMVGGNVAGLLAANCDAEELLAGRVPVGRLQGIKGIGEVVAQNIVTEIRNLLDSGEMALLRKAFPSFAPPPATAASGETICFTGAMSRPRGELQKIAAENGFVPVDSVTRSTKILVCADPASGSSKLKNAAKLGVRIISEADFWTMCAQHPQQN